LNSKTSVSAERALLALAIGEIPDSEANKLFGQHLGASINLNDGEHLPFIAESFLLLAKVGSLDVFRELLGRGAFKRDSRATS